MGFTMMMSKRGQGLKNWVILAMRLIAILATFSDRS
jgi:hypothetical protein